MVFRDRLVKLLRREVRPEHVGEIKLAVSALPQQKVGDALLPAGADQQLRVGDAGGIEIAPELGFADLLRRFAVPEVGGIAHRGTDDLVPAAVVETDIGLEALIARRDLVGLGHELAQLLRQTRDVAEDLHLDVVALHRVDGLVEIFPQQTHDRFDLVLGALPVLGGEGVDREVLHADVPAVGRDLAEVFRAHGVARRAGQAAALGPAAVAVENDRDMAGRSGLFRSPRRDVLLSHQISLSSLSLRSVILSISLM